MKKPQVVRNPHKTSVIYHNGKAYKKLYLNETTHDRLSRYFKRFVVLPFVCTVILFISGSVFLFYWNKARGEEIRFETREVPVVIREVPPILRKIADCESSNKHEKNNRVVLGDSGKSIGRYQINVTVWGQQAHDLGYDLYDEHDNELFAVWLLDHKGTAPWFGSSKCWNV